MKDDKKEYKERNNGKLKYILLLLFVLLMLVFAGFSLIHFLAYKRETDYKFNEQNQNLNNMNQKVMTLADRFNEIPIMEFNTTNYMDILHNIQNAYELDSEELFYSYLAYQESETDEQKQANLKDYSQALINALIEYDTQEPIVIPTITRTPSDIEYGRPKTVTQITTIDHSDSVPLILMLLSLGLFMTTGIPATI